MNLDYKGNFNTTMRIYESEDGNCIGELSKHPVSSVWYLSDWRVGAMSIEIWNSISLKLEELNRKES